MDGRKAAAVLGVSPRATKREISRAFRAGAKVHHPDACGSDGAFIALRAAFDVLHPHAPDDWPLGRRGPTWFEPAPDHTIDLTDSAGARRRPTRTGPSQAGQPCDTSGMTFADHLDAQLQRLR
jgi:hypothetical protein